MPTPGARRPRVDFVAVHDVDSERARAVAGRHDASVAASTAEVMDGEQVDAVLIASSTPTHTPLLRAAAEAGLGLEPVEVFVAGSALAEPRLRELGDVDTSVALLTLENGALVQIDSVRRTGYGYDERVEVFGSEGMVEVRRATAREASRGTARAGWSRTGFPRDGSSGSTRRTPPPSTTS